MIGVGGWGGRDERHGPYVKYNDGEMVLDYSPGHGGAQTGSSPWPAIDCVGFVTLIQRGAEWAATGEVTQAVPEEFPSAGGVSLR